MRYSSREESFYNMKPIFSKKMGIISKLHTDKICYKEDGSIIGNFPCIYSTSAQINEVADNDKIFNLKCSGGGISFNKDESIIKAVGECIERYCASHLNQNAEIIYESVDNLNRMNINYIHPRLIIHYDESQYNNKGSFKFIKRYENNQKIFWMKCKNITQNTYGMIPLRKIYLSMPQNMLNKEPYLDGSLSTGLACGNNLHEAILSGIYERLERDNLYLTWMCKIPGEEILIDKIKDKELDSIYKSIQKYFDNKVYCIDISKNNNIYTILTLMIDDKREVCVSTGCASNLNPEKALKKALVELIQVYNNGVITIKNKDFKPIKSKEEIRDISDHYFYYLNKSKINVFKFLYKNLNTKKLSLMKNNTKNDLKLNIKTCVECLKKESIDIYYANITTPQINDYNLAVVNVIIPELEDLDIGYDAPYLGGRRLNNYLRKGYSVNTEPHFFP